jgi:hypothetical protein
MLLKELLTGGHKHSVGHVSGVQRIDSVDLAKARLAKRHKEQEVAKQHEETDAVLRALGEEPWLINQSWHMLETHLAEKPLCLP